MLNDGLVACRNDDEVHKDYGMYCSGEEDCNPGVAGRSRITALRML